MTEVRTNPNKALWEQGDFTRIAASMRESGEELVGELGIEPGARVLDLGCGDGTTALPEARLGADVLGVDIAANLVAAGNERAAAEGREAELDAELTELFERQNVATKGATRIPATYLRVTART
ncbi:MAG TPA: methyltransferase domain-containing protein [Solirubrobacterales bacterium]